MPRVVFTPHLRKHLASAPAEVAGQTVAEALAAVFEREPNLRGYLLDDQNRVRQHVMIFVDNRPLNDRERLTDRVCSTSEIYVMQAFQADERGRAPQGNNRNRTTSIRQTTGPANGSTIICRHCRKGLFVWSRGHAAWVLEKVHFLGEPVTMLLPDQRDGTLYASLTLGHFGVKLRRLSPGAEAWEECGVPIYPVGAEVNAGPPTGDGAAKTKPASLTEIWSLEAGGTDEPGVLWSGTIPGGLFRSDDGGRSWRLNESLWNRPERSRWFGGGKDEPGIHSVWVDPCDSQKLTLGISCGGVWRSSDGGQSWDCRSTGLRAEYVPPELAGDPITQDPHRIAACAADPATIWMQHHNGVFLSRDGGGSRAN